MTARPSPINPTKLTLLVLLLFAAALSPVACGDKKSSTPSSGNQSGDLQPTLISIGSSCSETADCAEEAFCWPDRGCVECLTDSDCAPGFACHNLSCINSIPCNDASDCGDATDSRYQCDDARGECVQCLDDSQCLGGFTCQFGWCVQVTGCHNSLDCPKGQVCREREDYDEGECVGCVSDAECGAGAQCFDSKCVPSCISDVDCVPVGLLCDKENGHCVECLAHDDCPSDQHCVDGACELDICREGDVSCIAGEVGTCDAAGSQYETEPCPEGRACVMRDGEAQCVPELCPPNGLGCSENERYVLQCDAFGTDFREIQDCATANQVCREGRCLSPVCTPGQKFCRDGSSYLCNEAGTQAVLAEKCGVRQTCNDERGVCETQACRPGAVACDGDRVVSCDASGLGSTIEDCTQSDQVCLDGACTDVVCDAGTTFCESNSVVTCVAKGTQKMVVQACFEYQYCDDSGAQPACAIDVCTPDQNGLDCFDDVVGECAEDGSGMVGDPVEDCGASGETCVDSACEAVVCVPNQSYCDGIDRRVCNASGTATTLAQSCGGKCQNGLCLACVDISFCQGQDIYDCVTSSSSTLERTCTGSCVEIGDTAVCSEDLPPDAGIPDAGGG